VKHGKWFMYDQSGRLITEVTYKDGKKTSASQHAYASVK
jgi:antitoxin component YwqK of YwqJK toxin-antitoxin module